MAKVYANQNLDSAVSRNSAIGIQNSAYTGNIGLGLAPWLQERQQPGKRSSALPDHSANNSSVTAPFIPTRSFMRRTHLQTLRCTV